MAAAAFALRGPLQEALSSGGGADACPLAYRRLALTDIRGGAVPYLMGGPQQPRCSHCHRDDTWAEVCQYRPGAGCPDWVRRAIVDRWLERGHELALALSPCDLWPLVRGRTLWFVGDSMMLDFFKATQCFLYEFWPSLQQRNASADPAVQGPLSAALPALCADLLQGTALCFIRADQGEQQYGVVLPALTSRQLASPADLLVVNHGLHHWHDYEEQLRAFAAYVAQHRDALPRVFWQQTSQMHFQNELGNGEYPGGQPPFTCAPIANFTVEGDGRVVLEAGKQDSFDMLRGNWRNALADPIVGAAGIPVLPSFNETLWMHDMHRDNGAGLECTHFCQPSAPQTWVLALYRALRDSNSRSRAERRGGGLAAAAAEGAAAASRRRQ